MKRMIFILATLLGLESIPVVMAQEVKSITPGVFVSHFKMERNGKYLTVEMGVDLTELESCRVAHATFGQWDRFT